MKKIIDNSVLDIVPYSQGFVFAKRESIDGGGSRAAFYCFNVRNKKVEAIRRTAYLQCKFGDNYETIARTVGNYIFCDSVRLTGTGETIVLFPESKMYYIDSQGDLIWDEDLCYRDSPVQGLALDEDCIWCVVPEKSAIVRFSPSLRKIFIRIGGNETTTFRDPVGISKVGNALFVSCGSSKKIRKIELQTYSVRDYKVFDEPVYKYYKVLDKEFALLESGLYML